MNKFNISAFQIFNRYIEASRDVSRRYRDQPLTPIETAVYWTEYVIRHKGSPHLRSASMELNWFEYHNVDVLGSLGFAFFLIVIVVLKLFAMCYRRVCGRGKVTAEKVTKKRQ